jgi:nucleoside-diphosphate kinase
MSEKLQRTLVLLKIDAIHRGIAGEIITRFERRGFKMVGLKMLVTDEDTAKQHYTEDLAKRRGEVVRERMIKMLTSGPIVAIALEGIEVIEAVRQMVGETQPLTAAPGTIRGDFAHQSYAYADAKDIGVFNLIHASDAPETAESELAVWFKSEELVEHQPDYTRLTLHEE